ncbi:DNA methylase, N-6 adenine-specific, conserved site [Penicillium camemberti]|uniref:DNA methylase, N-6 adenine-specific, conserved site n=1 Tax=Penicillium camemberti (strain FM 013) TaxID=1429867 RepID=A0A0G4PKJ4_PENC3|nr:DNA methylase, N-6 adenine-specific, conserved site [Penicillium camemberti]
MAIKVPPGQSPPFETIDDKHHGGIIIITAAICLVISLVCLLIRVYVRIFLNPPWGSDDIILLGATISAIVESIIIFHAASIGFGTDISLLTEKAVGRIQNSLLGADILYLLTLYLSKCCIIAIYLRLTPRKRHKSILWATFGLSTAWIIMSVLIIAVNCQGNKPWVVPGEQCHNLFPRWQAIAALDISTEILLFTFCIALVWGLQMHISHKMVIMVSFAARLPLIIFSGLHLSTLKEYTTIRNPTFTAIRHTVFTQLHLNFALVACTVFCLRPFMNALTTHYGTAGDSNLGSSSGGYGYGYGSRPRGNTDPYTSGRSRDYEMGTVKERSGRRPSGLFKERPDVGDGTENGTVICEAAGPSHLGDVRSEGDRGSMRSGSDGSTKMIIRKDVEYSVSVGHS